MCFYIADMLPLSEECQYLSLNILGYTATYKLDIAIFLSLVLRSVVCVDSLTCLIQNSFGAKYIEVR